MSDLNKLQISIVGMCFREHGRPYLNHINNVNDKKKEIIEIIKVKKENNSLIKELIDTKIELANQKAENDKIKERNKSLINEINEINKYKHLNIFSFRF